MNIPMRRSTGSESTYECSPRGPPSPSSHAKPRRPQRRVATSRAESVSGVRTRIPRLNQIGGPSANTLARPRTGPHAPAMLRRLAVPLAVAASGACQPTASLPDQSVTVILADGTSPTATNTASTLVRGFFFQPVAGGAEDVVETPIVSGAFDLVIPLETYSETMQFRLEFADATSVQLVGGTPAYYPAESLRLFTVVGAEGTCKRRLDAGSPLRLFSAREHAGGTLLGTYAFIAGGVGNSGPTNAIDAIDQLAHVGYQLSTTGAPSGPAEAVPVSRSRALVAVEGAAPYVHRLYVVNSTDVRSTPTLHAGADTADALVAYPNEGALVVGGGPDGAASATCSHAGSTR